MGFARTLRDAVSLPVAAVGLITDPAGAQAVLDRGDADYVAVGREIGRASCRERV